MQPRDMIRVVCQKELSFINNLANEWKEMKQINCTGCNYCMPCPNNVNIPGASGHTTISFSQGDALMFPVKNTSG